MRSATLALTLTTFAVLASCGGDDDDVDPGIKDAAADASGVHDAGASDVRPADSAVTSDGGGGMRPAAVIRGEYLANSVLGCVGCHTPPAATGTERKLLSGVDCFIDTSPPATNGMGCLSSSNLTPDKDTGLGNATDAQIKDLFLKGVRPQDGKYLFAQMPYHQYGNLSAADADAVVAYLRSLPAIIHRVQANEAPFDKRPDAPEWSTVPLAQLPGPAMPSAAQTNGKYLAALACATCHTIEAAGTPKKLDAAKAYQGGKVSTATIDAMSRMVYATNLTPDDTGIKGWTAADLVRAMRMGRDKDGRGICAPMRPLAGLTEQDAMDIASYLLALPAAKTEPVPMTCSTM